MPVGSILSTVIQDSKGI